MWSFVSVFSQHKAFKVHPRYSMCQYLGLLIAWMYHGLSIHLLMVIRLFYLLVIVCSAAVNIHVQVFI